MHPQEQAIHGTLSQTLLAGRLAPGSQLVETRLAQVFGVSRERVHKVLHWLGHERLLDLMRALQELVSRTAMLVAFFEAATASACACEEHDDIVQALRRGDAARATKAMHVPLSLIETRLTPRAAPQGVQDADTEIARAWAAHSEHAAAEAG